MKDQRILNLIKQKYFLLFVLWCSLTAININKAFHIDDTFHLEAAENIMENPLEPMSGLLNWANDPVPLYHYNQPPLFFYMIALHIKLFGNSEISLHLFLSIFTFLVLYFFQRITYLLPIENKKLLLTLFAFNPAFIVNQNLMMDVPILAVFLGTLFFVLKAKQNPRYYIYASMLIATGLLIKYSVLPLLVVLAIVILVNRDFKSLFVLLIPIGVLAFWSLWNYYEFDAIHILNRRIRKFDNRIIWVYLGAIGALSSFVFSFAYGTIRLKIIKNVIYFSLILFTISVVLFYSGFIHELQYTKHLINLFEINGFLIYLFLIILIIKLFYTERIAFITTDKFVILLFLASITLFIILYAPFIATRHLLLVIPFILLFGSDLIDKTSVDINRVSLITTIILGVILGISDWKYADYYRKMAVSIELPKDTKVWFLGHWGWQWYAKKNGMEQYFTTTSKVRDGDYIVFPIYIDKQKVKPTFDLIVRKKIWEEADIFTLFSDNNDAGFYSSNLNNPPWRLSKEPIDTIYICEVERGVETIIRLMKSDENWMKLIEKKAEKNGIPIDSMIVKDAKWILKKEKNELNAAK